MLTAYLTQTQALLQLPAAPATLYTTTDLTRYINIARGQLAGEAECIRVLASLAISQSVTAYDFSTLTLPAAATAAGVAGVINVRQLWYVVASGQRVMYPRAWEWFSLYNLNNVNPQQGEPSEWSQYGQGAAPGNTGAAAGGSLYISPSPVVDGTLNCDCVCYPVSLVDDTTKEAIPYLWTDAVPYFAAYLALLSAQTEARRADAEAYYNLYLTFVQRARGASNPSPGRWQYSQAQDPVQAAKLGRSGGPSIGGG